MQTLQTDHIVVTATNKCCWFDSLLHWSVQNQVFCLKVLEFWGHFGGVNSAFSAFSKREHVPVALAGEIITS